MASKKYSFEILGNIYRGKERLSRGSIVEFTQEEADKYVNLLKRVYSENENNKTLLDAQNKADNIVNEAVKKANVIIEEASSKAKEIVLVAEEMLEKAKTASEVVKPKKTTKKAKKEEESK